jgi:hypothetical protein
MGNGLMGNALHGQYTLMTLVITYPSGHTSSCSSSRKGNNVPVQAEEKEEEILSSRWLPNDLPSAVFE